MHKGPIWAIIVSVIAIVSIYFLTDIKENQDIQAINKVIDSNDNEIISRFLESIDEEDRNTALSLFEEAKSSQNSENVATIRKQSSTFPTRRRN